MKKKFFTVVLCFMIVFIFYIAFPDQKKQQYRKLNPSNIIVISSSSLESKFNNLKTFICNNSLLNKFVYQWRNSSHEHWQKAGQLPLYLLNAYYDTRTTFGNESYHYVRILSSIRGNVFERSLFCQFWIKSTNSQQIISIEAETLEIWVNSWNKDGNLNTYRTVLLSCPVPFYLSKSDATLEYVSISTFHCGNINNKIEIRHNKISERTRKKSTCAVCVKGLNFDQDISNRLVEWIEFNLMFGARKIFFYIFNVHPNVEKVLKYYSDIKAVVTIPITLPGGQPNDPINRTLYLKKNLWQKRRNELVPYNDCLYRNIYDYEFVLPLDIDELVIPVSGSSWLDVLESYAFEQKQSVLTNLASLSVKNVYFFEQFDKKQSFVSMTHSEIPQKFFYMLNHRERSVNFSKPGHSVKSFIYTNRTKTVFNHYALHTIFVKYKQNAIMPERHAQMNHYKPNCPKVFASQCNKLFFRNKTTDNLLNKYESEIVKRIENAFRKIKL